MTVRLGTLGLGDEPGGRNLVVHDLALESGHRVQRALRAGVADLRNGGLGELDQRGSTLGPVPGDVEHESAALAGLGLDGEPGELLEGLEHLALGADETPRDTALVRVDDGNGCPVDVNVEKLSANAPGYVAWSPHDATLIVE